MRTRPGYWSVGIVMVLLLFLALRPFREAPRGGGFPFQQKSLSLLRRTPRQLIEELRRLKDDDLWLDDSQFPDGQIVVGSLTAPLLYSYEQQFHDSLLNLSFLGKRFKKKQVPLDRYRTRTGTKVAKVAVGLYGPLAGSSSDEKLKVTEEMLVRTLSAFQENVVLPLNPVAVGALVSVHSQLPKWKQTLMPWLHTALPFADFISVVDSVELGNSLLQHLSSATGLSLDMLKPKPSRSPHFGTWDPTRSDDGDAGHPLALCFLRCAVIDRLVALAEGLPRPRQFDYVVLTQTNVVHWMPYSLYREKLGAVLDTTGEAWDAFEESAGVVRTPFSTAVEEGPLPIVDHYKWRKQTPKEKPPQRKLKLDQSERLRRVLRGPRYATVNKLFIPFGRGFVSREEATQSDGPNIVGLNLHGSSVVDSFTANDVVVFASTETAAGFLSQQSAFFQKYARFLEATVNSVTSRRKKVGRLIEASSSRLMGYFLVLSSAHMANTGKCGAPYVGLFSQKGHFPSRAVLNDATKVPLNSTTCPMAAYVDFHISQLSFTDAAHNLEVLALEPGYRTFYSAPTRFFLQTSRMACYSFHRKARKQDDAIEGDPSRAFPNLVKMVVFRHAQMAKCTHRVLDGGFLVNPSNVVFLCETDVPYFGNHAALFPNVDASRSGFCLSPNNQLESTVSLLASPSRDRSSTEPVAGKSSVPNIFQDVVRCAVCEHRDVSEGPVVLLEDDLIHSSAEHRTEL